MPTLDNDETVNRFTLYADILKAIKNTDIRFAYDFMDSDNAFIHGGPRIQQLNTNTSVTGSACSAGVSDFFIPLPDVTTSWNRFMADVKYFFGRKVGIAFGWYFRKARRRRFCHHRFERIDWLQSRDGCRSYRLPWRAHHRIQPTGLNGNTAFLRLPYLF